MDLLPIPRGSVAPGAVPRLYFLSKKEQNELRCFWGGGLGLLGPAPSNPQHPQLTQSSCPSMELGEEEPNFCHRWLHRAGGERPNFSWGGENWPQNSPAQGHCPLLSHPRAGTARAGQGNHRESPATPRHCRCWEGSGILGCRAASVWGSLGLGAPLFPAHSPPWAPSHHENPAVGAGKLGVRREGAEVTPAP